MGTTISYILLTALRDRLFAGLFIALLVMAYVSFFLGGTALVEEWQLATAYFAGGSRLTLNFGLIVFVCFHIRRAMENKEIDVILSRPISRQAFIVAYWMALVIAAILLVIPVVAITGWLGYLNTQGFLDWTITLLLEAAITVALAQFFAMRLSSVMGSVIASVGFYLLSRLMGFFILTTQTYVAKDNAIDVMSGYLLKAIAVIMPRLDMFAQSQWLIEGVEQSNLWLCFSQSIAYVGLLLAASIFDLRRRQF